MVAVKQARALVLIVIATHEKPQVEALSMLHTPLRRGNPDQRPAEDDPKLPVAASDDKDSYPTDD